MDKKNNINHNYYFFMVAGKKWGLDIGAIKEVGELTDVLCPVPHAQYAVMGYMNVRGEIHQIISFRSLLAGKKVEDVSNGFVLFFKKEIGHAFGLYIDEACEICGIENEDIEEWNTNKSQGVGNEFDMADYLTKQVYRDQEELIPLIEPKRIPEAINIKIID